MPGVEGDWTFGISEHNIQGQYPEGYFDGKKVSPAASHSPLAALPCHASDRPSAAHPNTTLPRCLRLAGLPAGREGHEGWRELREADEGDGGAGQGDLGAAEGHDPLSPESSSREVPPVVVTAPIA